MPHLAQENAVNLNTWRGLRCAVITAVVLAVGACGKGKGGEGGGGGGSAGGGTGAAPSGAIVIGHFASMTGPQATFGISTRGRVSRFITASSSMSPFQ